MKVPFSALVLLTPAVLTIAGWSQHQDQSPNASSSSEIANLKDEAKAGDSVAQRNLANAYEQGKGVNQDDVQAATWYRRAADQGDSPAMNSLGVLYKYGRGVERSDEQEVRYYRMAAKLGNAEAMFNLGTCYFEGNGVGVDDTRSSAWFFLSQQAGYANAGEAVKRFIDGKPPSREVEMIFAAARMYEEGVDVPTNRSAALTWYRKAADKGSAAAQVKVASLLIDQTASSSDYTEARQRCETAAKWKYSPGDVCLGVMYQRGLGVKQDPSEAVKWFSSGAEHGNTAAMLHLATAYLEGNGVQPNRTTACMWKLIAFSLSPTEAQAQQAEVPGVSEQEMVAAKGQAAEWIKRHKSLVSTPFQRSPR